MPIYESKLGKLNVRVKNMYKKIVFFLLLVGSIVSLNANSINLADFEKKNFAFVSIGLLKAEKKGLITKEQIGKEYLIGVEKVKYRKVYNDQFDLEDAINEAYLHTLKSATEMKKIMSTNRFHLIIKYYFGKWNSKTQKFYLSNRSTPKSISIKYDNGIDTRFETFKIENNVLEKKLKNISMFADKTKAREILKQAKQLNTHSIYLKLSFNIDDIIINEKNRIPFTETEYKRLSFKLSNIKTTPLSFEKPE